MNTNLLRDEKSLEAPRWHCTDWDRQANSLLNRGTLYFRKHNVLHKMLSLAPQDLADRVFLSNPILVGLGDFHPVHQEGKCAPLCRECNQGVTVYPSYHSDLTL